MIKYTDKNLLEAPGSRTSPLRIGSKISACMYTERSTMIKR